MLPCGLQTPQAFAERSILSATDFLELRFWPVCGWLATKGAQRRIRRVSCDRLYERIVAALSFVSPQCDASGSRELGCVQKPGRGQHVFLFRSTAPDCC